MRLEAVRSDPPVAEKDTRMTIDQLLKLLDAAISLLSTLIWPAVVVFAVLFFGAPLKKIVSDAGELSLKAGASGVEATVRRNQIEAAALLGAASAKPRDGATPLTPDGAKEIARTVGQAGRPIAAKRLAESTVLWVDDRPDNNANERRALEALGLRFVLVKSTDGALEVLEHTGVDAIISDMGRPPDPQAGYTLLERLRKSGSQTPFVIYASSNLPEHRQEAQCRGAVGSTNDPRELFQLLLGALQAEPG
jgi:CheY-like chemotaxis protein